MRIWQKAMIALARSKAVTRMATSSKLMQSFARQFVGGDDGSAAIVCAQDLRRRGIKASLFYLGEYVDDLALVERGILELEAIIPRLAQAGLDVHVSLDPTQAGSMQSLELCRENALRLARAVATHGAQGRDVLMLDMEDSSVTQKTLDLYYLLRSQSLPAAITMQAYLRRTEQDLERLTDAGAMVRLVKGALAEPGDIAFTSRERIDEAYRAGIRRLFGKEARERGVYPVLGTHDHRMVEYGVGVARDNGWSPEMWEVEMLFGVRPDFQRRLVEQGLALRLYLPFGESWWPYSIRRVGENPRNGWFVLRSLFGGRRAR